VTRIAKTTKHLAQVALAVWAVGIPLLEMPDAAPELACDADRMAAEVCHDPHACEQSCVTTCAKRPPDVCSGTTAGGCGGSAPQECPMQSNCYRCLTTGDHLVYVNPGVVDPMVAFADHLIPPSNQTAPVNLFQPPVPPPKSA
jgi:hypothetical protein